MVSVNKKVTSIIINPKTLEVNTSDVSSSISVFPEEKSINITRNVLDIFVNNPNKVGTTDQTIVELSGYSQDIPVLGYVDFFVLNDLGEQVEVYSTQDGNNLHIESNVLLDDHIAIYR